MNHEQMLIGLGALAGLGLLSCWAYVRRASRRAANGVREATRFTTNLTRAVVVAAVITGLEWVIVAHVTDWRIVLAVLGVPALLAGSTVARLFTVADVVYSREGYRR